MAALSEGEKIPKSEQTRNVIINAFLDLILEKQKKWDNFSVKEICARSGITRGTFYQYFDDIYDLIEQIEIPLLDDISKRYDEVPRRNAASFSSEMFVEKFDYSPPLGIYVWFDFCKKHKKEILVLLDSKLGDACFRKKLKDILRKHVNDMMDDDGMPRDGLRTHFVKLFVELHFLSVLSWLGGTDDGDGLSTGEILSLLNVMRVGGNYLSYKKYSPSDYDMKMNIPDKDD